MLNAQKVHSKGCKLSLQLLESFYIHKETIILYLQMPQKFQNVFKPPNRVVQLTKATFSLWDHHQESQY
jgi:hypothetical protein